MLESYLKDILIIFAISIPVVLVLKKIHFPVMIGFILSGTIIGPTGLQIINDVSRIESLAELGIALLLFSVGLEFSHSEFKQLKNRAILAGALQILLTSLAGWFISGLWGWSLAERIYFSSFLSLSSTAVVLTVFYAKRLIDSLTGKLCSIILIVQDLMFIPMIIFLPLVSNTQGQSPELAFELLPKLFALIALIALGFIGRYILEHALKLISTIGRREIFIITIMFLGLGSGWLAHHWGLSFALGAFLGGLVVGFTNYKYQALSEITPFRYCFNSLFFVSIGMLFNPYVIALQHFELLLLLVVIFATKFLMTLAATSITKFPLRVGVISSLSLAQMGEFSFLLIHVGRQNGILSQGVSDLWLASIVIGMIFSPFIITNSPKIVDWFSRRFRKTQTHTKRPTEISSQELNNHIIICGFGPLGKSLGHLLNDHLIPYVVLELNAHTIDELKKHNIHARFGDGTSAEILYHSGIEHARILAITVPDYLDNLAIMNQARQMNPDIKIITRAKYRSDAENLYAAGADVVISEELEAGIEMGRYALEMADVPTAEVENYIKRIRSFGSADFF